MYGRTILESRLLTYSLPPFVAFALTIPSVSNELTYDDTAAISHVLNSTLQPGRVFLEVGRSITHLSFYFDRALYGSSLYGFHLTNVLLHSLASFLVALTTVELSSNRRVGLLSGLLFAVHPVHIEVVASIANRKDSLAMIFALCSLYFYIKQGSRVQYGLLTLLCLMLGLLSKEVALLGVAPMLFVADHIRSTLPNQSRKRSLTSAVFRVLPILLPIILVLGRYSDRLLDTFTSPAIHSNTDALSGTYYESIVIFSAYVLHIPRLLLLPIRLSADYSLDPLHDLTIPAIAGGLLLLGWILVAVFVRRLVPLASFSMFWVLITYLPTSPLLPLSQHPIADRYLYVPSYGLCLLLAIIFSHRIPSLPQITALRLRSQQILLFTILLALFSLRSYSRLGHWKNNAVLWSAAVARNATPSPRALINHAAAQLRLSHPQQALDTFQDVLHKIPNQPNAILGTGVALTMLGRDDEAAKILSYPFPGRGLRESASLYRAVALLNLRRFHEASDLLSISMFSMANSADAHYLLALARSHCGDLSSAVSHLERAIQLRPGSRHYKAELDLLRKSTERGTPLRESSESSENAIILNSPKAGSTESVEPQFSSVLFPPRNPPGLELLLRVGFNHAESLRR